MRKMLFIVGMLFISLGFSNVYGQASFVPIVVNVHVAAGTGKVLKPTLSFYKVSNPTVVTDFYDWYNREYFVEGSSGVFYVPVQNAGTYNIVFNGVSPSHKVTKSNQPLEIGKGYYNLDIYVEPLTNSSRMIITGSHN